jgi:hypothetical protein
MSYEAVNGVYLPVFHPDRDDLPWHWPLSLEDGLKAKALFDADPCGKLMVPFEFQPDHVRAKYFEQVQS